MNHLHDLTRRIDALTANAQQVLNALIRSCIASGSSSGYKVTKYGHDILLDRADIYRLYNFYQEWEEEFFPSDPVEFGKLLTMADEMWRKPGETTTLASDVLVKHAQILYMDKSNSSRTSESDRDYWIDRIRTSGTPKAVTSTAPIPLNLRTPLYDENLSTKSFSQFETYLFPMGYHRAEILGVPGNGESYVAGGENWSIEATDRLLLSGNHITLGDISDPENRLLNYGDSRNTLSWGTESYALADISATFGDHSLSVADRALTFGTRCSGYGDGGFIAGGEKDFTIGDDTFASNKQTLAAGDSSFAANTGTVAGAWSYRFTMASPASDPKQVDCEAYRVESTNTCVLAIPEEASALSANYKVIRVSAAEVRRPKFAKPGAELTLDVLDIKVGDYVYIYDMSYRGPDGKAVSPNDDAGYANRKFGTLVTGIVPVYRETVSGQVLDSYEITLKEAIPVEAPKYGAFVGGRIVSALRTLNVYNKNGVPSKERHYLGTDSATFGHYTVARGRGQTTVGSMNVPNDAANFIVGVGSSYIYDLDAYRANGLLVSPNYSYMKLEDGQSYIGVSSGLYPVPDAENTLMYKGAFMRSGSMDDDSLMSLALVSPEHASLHAYGPGGDSVSFVSVGDKNLPGTTTDYVTSILKSVEGTAVIASGSYVRQSDPNAEKLNLVDTFLDEHRAIWPEDHGIAIYAEDGIDIRNSANPRGRGINIETCAYLSQRFKGLLLKGDTFGTLSATDMSRSHVLEQRTGGRGDTGKADDIKFANTAGHSGFYYASSSGNGSSIPGQPGEWNATGSHVFNSTVKDSAGKFHSVTLAVPDADPLSATSIRPLVTVSRYDGIGNSNTAGNYRSEPIALMSDVMLSGRWFTGAMSQVGFVKPAGASDFYLDNTGKMQMPIAQGRHGDDWSVMSGYAFGAVYDSGTANSPWIRNFAIYSVDGDGVREDSSVDNYARINLSHVMCGNMLHLAIEVVPGNNMAALRTYSSGVPHTHIRVPVFLGCVPDTSNFTAANIGFHSYVELVPRQFGNYSCRGSAMMAATPYGQVKLPEAVAPDTGAAAKGSARLPYIKAIAMDTGLVIIDIPITTQYESAKYIRYNLSGEVLFEPGQAFRGPEVDAFAGQTLIQNYRAQSLDYDTLKTILEYYDNDN